MKPQIPVTLRSPPKGNLTRVRKARPSVGLLRGRMSMLCACGCGESFEQSRHDQRFISGHRFASYTSHKCPECGTTHREGKGSA